MNKGYNNQDEGIYENTENFVDGGRHYLETPFGQVKVFVENGKIVMQFFTRKIKK